MDNDAIYTEKVTCARNVQDFIVLPQAENNTSQTSTFEGFFVYTFFKYIMESHRDALPVLIGIHHFRRYTKRIPVHVTHLFIR